MQAMKDFFATIGKAFGGLFEAAPSFLTNIPTRIGTAFFYVLVLFSILVLCRLLMRIFTQKQGSRVKLLVTFIISAGAAAVLGGLGLV